MRLLPSSEPKGRLELRYSHALKNGVKLSIYSTSGYQYPLYHYMLENGSGAVLKSNVGFTSFLECVLSALQAAKTLPV